jgi:hypothetical protein
MNGFDRHSIVLVVSVVADGRVIDSMLFAYQVVACHNRLSLCCSHSVQLGSGSIDPPLSGVAIDQIIQTLLGLTERMLAVLGLLDLGDTDYGSQLSKTTDARVMGFAHGLIA